ncbi:MAG: hypothetical protein WC343_11235 [Bacilli bacterium]|jgi:hypothetical protein
MKIYMTIREAFDKVSNTYQGIDKLCDDIGLNPYCLAEGADPDMQISMDIETTKKHEII